MKKGMIALLAALGMAALVAGGCANKEVVKSEEQIAAPAKAEPAKVVEEAKPEPPKPEPAKPEPAKMETVKVEPAEGQGAKASAAAVSFESVYFDFDNSDLRQDARDVLSKNAEALKGKSDIKIRVEGHCDERGSAEYNLALGERRAKSAMQYLITLGIPAERLSTLSYGKEKAQAGAKDESVWSKDRRGDLVIVK